MATKKTIAIIEASDDKLKSLSRSLATGSNRILLFGHNAAQLSAFAKELRISIPGAEVECSGCPMDASWEADAVILSLPVEAEKEISEKIRPFATQKVVIHISDTPAELESLLPHSRVFHLDKYTTNLESKVTELLQSII